MLTCADAEVPFPAFETLNDRMRLPRRYFLFFDLFIRCGTHNKKMWNNATTSKETIRFGSTMIEAHVKTTIRENYFRWMFQILSDPRCLPDPHMAADFKTEYDCEEEADFPEDLACSLAPCARLPKTCEIKYRPAAATAEEPEESSGDDETRPRAMGTFDILTTKKEKDAHKDLQQDQRKLIMSLASKHYDDHKHRLACMRNGVQLLRENREEWDPKRLKKAHADTKKRLKLYGNDEEQGRPKQKKRKSNNKRTDKKIQIFDANIRELDQDEICQYREAWEVMYKKIMNDHGGEDGDHDEDNAAPGVKHVQGGDHWIKKKDLDVTLWD
jgi:hypothetical protein